MANTQSSNATQQEVDAKIQDYRNSLFPNKDLKNQKAVVEKLQKAYVQASPEGRQAMLKQLGASEQALQSALTSNQKMDALHDSNALLQNISFKRMSASSLPQPKERTPEDYVKFSIVASEFAAAVGAASLSVIAAMAASDNLDSEMAAKILLVQLSIQAAMMAVGLLADGINQLVKITTTPEKELLADREKLFELQDKILTNRHNPKIVDKAMGESSKMLLKYANDPAISQQLNGINKTRVQLNSIIKLSPDTNPNLIKDLVQQNERDIANKVRENSTQNPQVYPPDMRQEEVVQGIPLQTQMTPVERDSYENLQTTDIKRSATTLPENQAQEQDTQLYEDGLDTEENIDISLGNDKQMMSQNNTLPQVGKNSQLQK